MEDAVVTAYMHTDWKFSYITLTELFILCTYLTNIQTDKSPISGLSFYTLMYALSDEVQILPNFACFWFCT